MPKVPKSRRQGSKTTPKQVRIGILRSFSRKFVPFAQEYLIVLLLFDIIKFSILFLLIGRVFVFAIQNPRGSLSLAAFAECS